MKNEAERAALEQRIRARLDAGDKQAAATALLEGYGREVLGFLVGRLCDRDAAAETFSLFTEELWKSMDTFRGDCSARVWAYTLARHAASRYIADAQKRRQRHVPLSRAGPLSAIAEKIRTGTLPEARTESRSRFAQLRDSLPVEDRTLIVLRVGRKLDWREIARIMTQDASAVADGALDKEAARLRKRYQLAKDRLRRLAEEQGLVPGDRD
jgi:RNA polymerase sigma-70 factor (ECF subfamily)